ncbi:MAG: lysylphosphatidylglycerol synthase transmembrane domain-containing protein, partial [Gaiellaceae bacterium]
MSGRRSSRRAKYLPAAVATAVTVVFGYLAVRNVDLDELGESLRESNYWFLLPSFALLVLAFFLRVVRWRCLFSPRTRPGWVPATEALLLGQFLNNVLPFRAGDAARIVALRSFGGPSRVETAGTVVIERIFDVLGLLLLLFVLLPVFPDVAWLRAAGVLAIVLTLALAAVIVVLRVYGERAVAFCLRPLARLPFLSDARVEAAIRNLTEGVIALRSVRIGLIGFFWTLVSWLVFGASFWCLMLGFDFGLSPVAGLLVLIATGLSHLLPAAPAAVGVFEAAAVVALGAYGIPESQALSYALVVHALNVVPFLLAGLL